MRSHRESISLIKGETGTGTPVVRQIRAHAFKGGEEIHACSLQTEAGLRRSIYGIARPDPSLTLPSSLSPYPPSRLPLARSRRSFLPVSGHGEPLSKSYATHRRSSVDYFSESSGSRIFKWRLNETGSPVASPSRSSLLLAMRERGGCLPPSRLDPDGALQTPRLPGISLSLSPRFSRSVSHHPPSRPRRRTCLFCPSRRNDSPSSPVPRS